MMCGSVVDDEILDITDETNDYICVGSSSEYGMNIMIFDSKATKLYTISKRGNYIVSFYGWAHRTGMQEKLYTNNRTEYWFDGKYYADHIDDRVRRQITRNTRVVLKQKISKQLYQFIRDHEAQRKPMVQTLSINPKEIEDVWRAAYAYA
jgi:hypothetical protein